MGTLHLQLLGGFQARVDEGPLLTFATRKSQALLAYLALRLGRPQTRDHLASLLWGDAGETQSRNSLRQTVFNLRKGLRGASSSLTSGAETVMLRPEATVVDIAAFARLAAEQTPTALAEAAALYRGDLLDGLNLREPAFEDWLLVERERLRELAFDVLARLLRQQADTGAPGPAIQTAARMLALDPLQEAVHRMLMRLYVREGRKGAARRQFQSCAELVQRELGVDVEPATRRLFQELVQNQGTGEPPGAAWFEEIRASRETVAPSVLVVEDELLTRTLLEEYLGRAGYEVHVAQDGAEALLHLGRWRFDVVLSDIAMPNLDGLKLLEVMSQQGMRTPAVFLTAMPGSELEIRGFELGAADFIRKPIQREVLLLRLKNVLRKTARRGG